MWRSTSTPSMPGSEMSSRTISGSSAASAARPSGPFACSVTANASPRIALQQQAIVGVVLDDHDPSHGGAHAKRGRVEPLRNSARARRRSRRARRERSGGSSGILELLAELLHAERAHLPGARLERVRHGANRCRRCRRRAPRARIAMRDGASCRNSVVSSARSLSPPKRSSRLSAFISPTASVRCVYRHVTTRMRDACMHE